MTRLRSLVGVFALSLATCTHAPRPTTPVSRPKHAAVADEATTRQEIADLLRETLDEKPNERAIGVVLIDGDETLVLGFGPRNQKDRRPMDADTTFEVGSIAKSMLGVLLADAVDRNEVTLEDPQKNGFPRASHLRPSSDQ